MDLKEAKRIARICATADSNCSCCVRSLCEEMQDAFPAFTWTFVEKKGVSRITVEPSSPDNAALSSSALDTSDHGHIGRGND